MRKMKTGSVLRIIFFLFLPCCKCNQPIIRRIKDGVGDNWKTGEENCLGFPCVFGWCENTIGGYNCKCYNGFKFNLTSGACEPYEYCEGRCRGGVCKNMKGWLQCNCSKGYVYDREMDACVDYDECSTNNNVCHYMANCENKEGGYACRCKDNFKGDGITRCDADINVEDNMKTTCSATYIKLVLSEWLVDAYGPFHFGKSKCNGILLPEGWAYYIRRSLTGCGTQVKRTDTHLIYSNYVTNTYESSVALKEKLVIQFSCFYPATNIYGILTDASQEQIGSGKITIGFPDENGKYPMTTVLPPYLDKDEDMRPEEYFVGKAPIGFNPNASVPGIGGKVIHGNPFMEEVIDESGESVIPGKNAPLPPEVIEIITDYSGGFAMNEDGPIEKTRLPSPGHDGFGHYNISIIPFTDDTYKTMQRKKFYQENEMIYIRILAHSQDPNVKINAHTCWATQWETVTLTPSVELVNDGCAEASSLRGKVSLKFNGKGRHADLSFPAFRFDGTNTLFIHCLVNLCNKKTDKHNKICNPDCLALTRFKRNIADETNNTNYATNVTLPIYVETRKNTTTGSASDLFESAFPAIVFVVFASTLCFCGFCICIRRQGK